MTNALRIEKKFHVHKQGRGRQEMRRGAAKPPLPAGRVPRISRLMALAIRFEGLIRDGVVTDQAELARLGHVSRARLTQIMNLRLLAPDIQEEVLFLPAVEKGRARVLLRDLQPIAAEVDWAKHRRMWQMRSVAESSNQEGEVEG